MALEAKIAALYASGQGGVQSGTESGNGLGFTLGARVLIFDGYFDYMGFGQDVSVSRGILGLRGHPYAIKVLTFGFAGGDAGPDPRAAALMGIGVYLALIMFLNVWGIIWPNQKIALDIKEADADAKAKAGRIAMLASRTNTLLSLPMLTSMAMYQTLYG